MLNSKLLNYVIALALIAAIFCVFFAAINLAVDSEDVESAYDYLTGLIFTLIFFVACFILDSPTVQDDSKTLKRSRNLAKHKEYEALDKLLDIDRGDSNA